MKRFLILWLLLPSLAFAWGETGHRVVCQIAYEEMQPDTRAELDRLMALAGDYDNFAESCLFADKPERIRWQDHFINLPRSSSSITTDECPMSETCILPAIRNDVMVLRDASSSDADRWHAIKLLGHWVGDIHQPMHVSFQDDRGANSNVVNASVDMKYPSLHSVWDYLIISEKLGDDDQKIATELRAEISKQQRDAWKHDSPIEWANESFQITISPAARYCVQQQGACWYSSDNLLLNEGEDWHEILITDEYLQEHRETVQLRLQKAGVRLAQLLNQSLGTGTQ
jgi:hypothetical protein